MPALDCCVLQQSGSRPACYLPPAICHPPAPQLLSNLHVLVPAGTSAYDKFPDFLANFEKVHFIKDGTSKEFIIGVQVGQAGLHGHECVHAGRPQGRSTEGTEGRVGGWHKEERQVLMDIVDGVCPGMTHPCLYPSSALCPPRPPPFLPPPPCSSHPLRPAAHRAPPTPITTVRSTRARPSSTRRCRAPACAASPACLCCAWTAASTASRSMPQTTSTSCRRCVRPGRAGAGRRGVGGSHAHHPVLVGLRTGAGPPATSLLTAVAGAGGGGLGLSYMSHPSLRLFCVDPPFPFPFPRLLQGDLIWVAADIAAVGFLSKFPGLVLVQQQQVGGCGRAGCGRAGG